MSDESGIIYSNSPNVQVPDENGVLRRANLVAIAPGEIVYQDNEKSTNVQVMGDDGNLHRAQLVAVVGGVGDQHNLGYYADQEALEEAHPTAEAGDWAIVGETDTVWIWDEDTSAWVDSDRKGQVTSVNNQTGDVTVQETLVSGTNIKSINGNSILGEGNLELTQYLGFPVSWPTTSSTSTKQFCDAVAADSTAIEGKMYLGEVRWNDLPAGIANSEVVVEIMYGTTSSNKVIVLTLTSGNVAPYRWQYTYWNGGANVSGWKTWQEPLVSGTNIKTINGSSVLGSGDLTISGLPSQTGNAGKFLTTDGTDASWSDKPLVNNATGSNSLSILGNAISVSRGTAVGKDSSVSKIGGTSCGYLTKATGIGAVALGEYAVASGPNSIQLGSTGSATTNGDANTFKVANENGNFEMMSADGTIPKARLVNALSSTTVTIAVADWNGGTTASKTINGLTATSVVFVAPDNASQSDYLDSGVYASAQTTDTLTFTCTTTPTSSLTVTVVFC